MTAQIQPEPAVTTTTDTTTDDQSPNREAARYRRQLKDTEAQLTAAQARLTAMERAHVERLAGEHLAQPADLWDIGKMELDRLRNGEGDLDDTLVAEAVTGLVEARPGLAKAQPRPFPNLGQGTRETTPGAPTYADVLGARP